MAYVEVIERNKQYAKTITLKNKKPLQKICKGKFLRTYPLFYQTLSDSAVLKFRQHSFSFKKLFL